MAAQLSPLTWTRDVLHLVRKRDESLLTAQVCLITELFTCGELADLVLQRGCYSEDDARECFVQLLKGIDYLHAK